MRAQGVPDRTQLLDTPGAGGTDAEGALVDGLSHELPPFVVEPAENVFTQRRQPDRALNDAYARDPGKYPRPIRFETWISQTRSGLGPTSTTRTSQRFGFAAEAGAVRTGNGTLHRSMCPAGRL